MARNGVMLHFKSDLQWAPTAKFVAILSTFLFALPCVAAERQMDQLLEIAVNLDQARIKQPGGLCNKADVPNSVITQVSHLLSTISATGLKDELGRFPAYYAVMADDPVELNRPLKLGYGVSEPFGSLLNAAAYWNSAKSAHVLLDRGVDPNLQNSAGGTPLLVAVSEGGPDVAVLLVHRGARFDARTLRYARACKNKAIVDLLVRTGVTSANER